jgi:catechol 2,3-dioxygenase-like lactoylglutathione lyase family enzyme
MKFKMSSNIALRTDRVKDAVDFYTRVIGFDNRSTDPESAELEASPITFYILPDDEPRGPVLELFVDDLEQARQELVASGCTILRWEGKGRDCYVQDPFGIVFNIWQT